MERKVKSLRIKWNGRTPRTFSLPIPFISHSEKTGEVLCDPIGNFPPEDGQRLLDLEGSQAELVETVYEEQAEPGQMGAIPTGKVVVTGPPLSLCQCGCGKSVSKEGNRFILGHSSKITKAPSQSKPEAEAVPA